MKYDFECTNCGYMEEVGYKITEVPKEIPCIYCDYTMKQSFHANPFILKGCGWDKPGHLSDKGGLK